MPSGLDYVGELSQEPVIRAVTKTQKIHFGTCSKRERLQFLHYASLVYNCRCPSSSRSAAWQCSVFCPGCSCVCFEQDRERRSYFPHNSIAARGRAAGRGSQSYSAPT